MTDQKENMMALQEDGDHEEDVREMFCSPPGWVAVFLDDEEYMKTGEEKYYSSPVVGWARLNNDLVLPMIADRDGCLDVLAFHGGSAGRIGVGTPNCIGIHHDEFWKEMALPEALRPYAQDVTERLKKRRVKR